jgi:hypothetical protein
MNHNINQVTIIAILCFQEQNYGEIQISKFNVFLSIFFIHTLIAEISVN